MSDEAEASRSDEFLREVARAPAIVPRPGRPLRLGDVVASRYRIEALAGRGGMGEVWQARDQTSGEYVALKVAQGVGDLADRFIRESELLAQIDAPGLVRYVAHGFDDGEPWLAMEWIEGERLDERLGRAPLTLQETLTLAARIARALGALHTSWASYTAT